MRTIILLLIASVALSACGKNYSDTRIRFDGEIFRGSAKAIDKSDRRVFIATAGPVSKSLAGAREALRYEGTKYCIKWFGISEINWTIDPQAEATALPMDGDKLVIQGSCAE